uniref:Prion-like-(Q/N-rich) domain-bearing protein 25 n=1 Tax=Syphacia muris TaxID=451379 RepID=A0A0N5AHW4_9BILA
MTIYPIESTIGTTCLSSSDCRGGEQCTLGTCQCSVNQISYNGRCLTNNNICTGGEQIYFNGRCLRTVSVNGQCETSSQCLSGSACFNSVCTCPTGTTYSNGACQVQNGICSSTQIYYQNQCYNLASIGQHCVIAAQCIGGSTCTNSVCQCPAGTTLVGQVCQTGSDGSTGTTCPNTQVSVNGMCLQRVSPGQSCQNTLQCLDGAECSANSICLCPTGMYIVSGFCRKFSSDDPCDQSTAVYINGQCLNVRSMGLNCQNTAQCLGGSKCINNICSCPTGTTAVNNYCVQATTYCNTNQVLFNNRCYSMASLGQSCFVTEQCPQGAECGYSAVCSCPYGSQAVNNQCVRNQGSSCTTNEVSINGVCYQYASPNGACTYSQQCLGDSTCINSFCQCSQNTILTLNAYCVSSSLSNGCNQNYVYVNGQCLAYGAPGSQCGYSSQCLGGSTCMNNVCACPNGYTNVMNYCVVSQSTSSCGTNEVYINGQCYQLRTINEYCLYNEQCQYGTTCQNNYCYCPSGYIWQGSYCSYSSTGNCGTNQVYINGMCYSIAYLGQTCQYAQQCQGGSTCLNNYCQCPSGWTQQGSSCVYNNGNTGGSCSTNQVLINGICYFVSSIGQTCQYTQQCLGGSICLNDYCQCSSSQVVRNNMCVSNGGSMCSAGQVYVNGQCLTQVQVNQFCYYNEQCLGNSNCTSNVCSCPSGTALSNNVCISSNANCRSYQVLVNGQCLDTVSIGMQCTDSSQCSTSASCIQTTGPQMTCQCNSGTTYFGSACLVASSYCPYNTVYISNNNCADLVSIGGSCSYTSQCMGFSACTNGICQCPYSYTNTNGVCRSTSSVSLCYTVT